MYGNFGLALYTCVTLNLINTKYLLYPESKWLDAFFKYYFGLIDEIEIANISSTVFEQHNIEFETRFKNNEKTYKALGEIQGKLRVIINI